MDAKLGLVGTNKSIPILTWQSAVVFVSHLCLGFLGFHFYQRGLFVALGWPALGAEIVFLSWWGWRNMLPALLTASILVHAVFWKIGFGLTMIFSLGEVAEIVVGAWLLGYGIDWSRGFYALQQARRGILVAAIAPVIGALVGLTGIMVGAGFILSSELSGKIFWGWWLRSVVGFIIVAPAAAAWRLQPRQVWGPNPREGKIVAGVVVLLVLLVFSDWIGPAHVPMWMGIMVGLPLLWSGGRCGIFLTTQLGLLVLAAASFATVHHVGVFFRFDDRDLLATWWMLLTVCASSGTALAILQHQSGLQAKHLQATRDRLKTLIQDSPLALVEWDLNYRIRSWSHQAEVIFGFSEEEALGQLGLELFVPDDGRAEMLEMLSEAMQGTQGVRSTHHQLTASGARILCDWYASPLHDERGRVIGVVSLVEDNSEWESVAMALRASENRFQTVSEVLPQAIAYYSLDGICLSGNRAFCKAHGIQKKEFPIPLESLAESESLSSIRERFKEIQKGEVLRYLESMQYPDGEIHDLDRILLPDFDEDGKVQGFFSVVTDITEYRVAEQEKFALESQVLQTQKLESLGLLSGRIAHEFNNRLCGILGHADMARQDVEQNPERAKNELEQSVAIAREASELCRQLFVYSGHGSGKKETLDLGPLVQEIRRLLELTLPKQVRLRTQLEPNLPKITCDASQLRQALVNLVQNAAQAIGDQRGEVMLRIAKIRLQDVQLQQSFLRNQDPQTELIEIQVQDNGDGIEAKDLSRIFEPFFSKRAGARGLGLAGVLGIVHGHSGGIHVKSKVGEGTCVSLYLPVSTSSSLQSPKRHYV